MKLPATDYHNPLEVLIRREEKSCKGCRHEKKYLAFGKAIWICTATDSKGMRRNHGKRCKAYREKK